MLLDISREITATLDLDRVLQSVVHLAARALHFDRGAVGLYEKGHCDIRAVSRRRRRSTPRTPGSRTSSAAPSGRRAGASPSFSATGRPRAPTRSGCSSRSSARISKRTTSAAGSTSRSRTRRASSASSSSSRARPTSPPRPSARWRRSSPTRRRWRSATRSSTTRCRWWTRSARWRPGGRRWPAVPRRRLLIYAGVGRRRSSPRSPSSAGRSACRGPAPRSGPRRSRRSARWCRASSSGSRSPRELRSRGERRSPYLRANALRADREATAAEAAVGRPAAPRSRPAGAMRRRSGCSARAAESLRRELALHRGGARLTVVRAPVSGMVLTPRPEERTGTSLEEGDLLLTLGRTDSLELEFGVDQQDIARVRPGQEVRLRVDALPQRTFAGRVTLGRPVRRRQRRRRRATRCAPSSPNPDGAAQAADDGATSGCSPIPSRPRTRLLRGPGALGAASLVEDLVMSDRHRPAASLLLRSPRRHRLVRRGPDARPPPARRARRRAVPPALVIADGGDDHGGPPAHARRRSSTSSTTPRCSPARPGIVEAITGRHRHHRRGGPGAGAAGEHRPGDRPRAGEGEARRARASMAERQRALTTAGFATQADSEQVEFEYREAELALRKAQRDFDLTRIVAPFGGVVTVARRAAAADGRSRRLALPRHRARAAPRRGPGSGDGGQRAPRRRGGAGPRRRRRERARRG